MLSSPCTLRLWGCAAASTARYVLSVVEATTGGTARAAAAAAFAADKGWVGGGGRGGVVKAIPTTSAPSHIRNKLRHEAEACLFITEMGPRGFSVNAIDPIRVFIGHNGILEVRINSEAQKWGGDGPAPLVKRSGAGLSSAPMRSVLSLVECYQICSTIYWFSAQRVLG